MCNGFGKKLSTLSEKMNKTYQGQSIYKVRRKFKKHPFIRKGDHFYLDNKHKNHIEVFTKNGDAKLVLNLDGSINKAKTRVALEKKKKYKGFIIMYDVSLLYKLLIDLDNSKKNTKLDHSALLDEVEEGNSELKSDIERLNNLISYFNTAVNNKNIEESEQSLIYIRALLMNLNTINDNLLDEINLYFAK